MATSRDEIKGLQAAQYGEIPSVAGVVATAKEAVNAMHRRTINIVNVADQGAAAAIAEYPFAHVRRAVRVRSITITVDATALAANDTDYVTMTIGKRTAGGSRTTIGTYDSRAANQGALTSMTPVEWALTAANVDLAAGDVLTYQNALGGSGKIVPAGCISVDVEEI